MKTDAPIASGLIMIALGFATVVLFAMYGIHPTTPTPTPKKRFTMAIESTDNDSLYVYTFVDLETRTEYTYIGNVAYKTPMGSRKLEAEISK